MRMHDIAVWGIGAVSLMVAAGCASSGQKPCMIIPAQIELARDVRDASRGSLEERQTDYARIKSNLEQSKLHMQRLIEERDQLKAEVGGAPAGDVKSQPTGAMPNDQKKGGQIPAADSSPAPTPPPQGGKK